MFEPSAIQRADDFVGIEMAMSPLSCAAAGCAKKVVNTVAAATSHWVSFMRCLLLGLVGRFQYLRLGNSLAATSIGKMPSCVTIRFGRALPPLRSFTACMSCGPSNGLHSIHTFT